jgi:exodeoxyribonuclease VII small subunit
MAKVQQSKNYKQMADELAGLIEWFDGSNFNLDEAVVKYEQAMRLLDEMEKYLEKSQNKIKKISVEFDNLVFCHPVNFGIWFCTFIWGTIFS